MTFYHFMNCLALAYVPHFLAYKYSKLNEYGAFWKCVHAGGTYLLVQLCKMMLLATFFPASENVDDGTSSNLISELLKASVDVADFIGIHVVMSRVAARGDVKVLVAAVGWATAELLFTRLLPLWVGARGAEFSWRHLVSAADTNISLIHYLNVAALLWLRSRTDLPTSRRPLVGLLLLLHLLHAPLVQLLLSVRAPVAVGGAGVMKLGVRALVMVCSSVQTVWMFAGMMRD